MAKITLNDITNLQNEGSAVSTINNNSNAVEASIENTLSRDGTSPNQMTSQLDMNSNQIINLPDALTGTSPISLNQFNAAAVRYDITQILNPTQQQKARDNIGVGSGGGGGGGSVTSVFTRSGAVTAQTGDYTVAQVTGAAPIASPTFTGVPASVTPTGGDSSTKIATTSYVQGEIAGKAPLASPTFTGVPVAPTAAALTNTTQIATTAFVQGEKASPTFTGTPLSTTAAVDTTTTQIATTAFVVGQAGASNPIMNGSVAVGTSKRYSREDHVHASDTSRASLASPTFTGVPAAPTAAGGTNTTQIATTAFVAAATGGGVADGAVTAIKLASSGIGYPDGMINGTIVASAASSALTIALKTFAGTDPTASDLITIPFRNATSATGNYTVTQVVAATSLVISSGSTMGVTSATPFRIWVVGFNDAGTFRLGAINCSNCATATATTITSITDGSVRSSTAEGGAGAADSQGVIYTGTAVTSKPMRILGFIEWNATGVTAGTWTTTNLSHIQLFGPGVPAPGQVVQVVRADMSVNNTTTSGTLQATGTTATITPTSMSNPIEVCAFGDTMCDNTSQNLVRIQNTTGPTPLGIGGLYGGYSNQGVGLVYSPISISGWHKPAVLTATTYTVYFCATVPGNSVNWGISTGTAITLREYMG